MQNADIYYRSRENTYTESEPGIEQLRDFNF